MESTSGTQQILSFIQEEWMLLLFLSILFFLYFHYTNTFDFFEKKGVTFMEPTFLLGNMGSRLRAKKSMHDFQLEIYDHFRGKPYGGMFEGRRPILYIFDPDILKAIIIRDFDHFVDRNSLNSREPNYLRRSLLNLKGQEWKAVRSILTPAFSSARLKNMLPLIQLCTNQLVEYLGQFDKNDVEMKDTMGHFTLEVIGACAFDIKCDALSDDNTYFIKVASNFNKMSKLKRAMIFSLLIFFPQAIKYLNITFLNRESTDELVRLLKAAKTERKDSGTKKNDFLQLLIDAAETEAMEEKNTHAKVHMDDDTVDAQALLFLIAGYETSSTLLSFAIHVLATRPDLQEKLRQHIQELSEGKELDYDLLSQMTYLDGFLMETLRMYPPVARVDRVCTKKYILPGSTVEINVGDIVAIPISGIHMDPQIYPEPHEFRPERFMGEEKRNRPSHLFLAFGGGPRNCIGLRFAMISAKMSMVALLQNFKFSVCDKTVQPIAFSKREFLLKAEKGVWVRIEAL